MLKFFVDFIQHLFFPLNSVQNTVVALFLFCLFIIYKLPSLTTFLLAESPLVVLKDYAMFALLILIILVFIGSVLYLVFKHTRLRAFEYEPETFTPNLSIAFLLFSVFATFPLNSTGSLAAIMVGTLMLYFSAVYVLPSIEQKRFFQTKSATWSPKQSLELFVGIVIASGAFLYFFFVEDITSLLLIGRSYFVFASFFGIIGFFNDNFRRLT